MCLERSSPLFVCIHVAAAQRMFRKQRSLDASSSRTLAGSPRAYVTPSEFNCDKLDLQNVNSEKECKKAASYLGALFRVDVSGDGYPSCYRWINNDKIYWNPQKASTITKKCGTEDTLCVCSSDVKPQSVEVCRSFSEWGHIDKGGIKYTTLCVPGENEKEWYAVLGHNPHSLEALKASDQEFFEEDGGE